MVLRFSKFFVLICLGCAASPEERVNARWDARNGHSSIAQSEDIQGKTAKPAPKKHEVLAEAPQELPPGPIELVQNEVRSCFTHTSEESCHWSALYDANQCRRENRCDKLVVFFARDVGVCRDLTSSKNKLKELFESYARNGYLAVCANLFENPGSELKTAFASMSGRVEAMMEHVRQSETLLQRWTGKHMLLMGSQDGASAAFAALKEKEMKSFQSKSHYSMCLHESSFDDRDLDLLLGSSAERENPSCESAREKHICMRHFGTSECLFPAFPDRLVADKKHTYAVKKLAVLQCPRKQKDGCEDDFLPASHGQSYCEKVNSRNDMECQLFSLLDVAPDCAEPMGWGTQCRQWFESNLKPYSDPSIR